MGKIYIDKNILFLTNCQGTKGVAKYLLTVYNFKNVNLIRNYDLIRNKKDLPFNLLKNADILIYQPISDRYGVYSSKNILKHIKSDCIKISFPYLFINCLFPLCFTGIASSLEGGSIMDDNSILNSNIIKDLKKKYKTDEIIKMYYAQEINFNFKKNYENNINRIKEKEKDCNIKLSYLFTLENISKVKLMNSYQHPTNYVYRYIFLEIVKILNLPKTRIPEFKGEITPHSKTSYGIYSKKFYNLTWLKDEDLKDDCYINLIKII